MKKIFYVLCILVIFLGASFHVFADPHVTPDENQQATSTQPVIVVSVLNPVASD